MTMTLKGLAKLVEECGELTQIAAKKMACMDTDKHWDDAVPLSVRLEEEMADVIAAIEFVAGQLGLDMDAIHARSRNKYLLFTYWDSHGL